MSDYPNAGLVAAATRFLEPIEHDYAGTLPLYDALVAYRDEGKPVGGFLTALLANDLRGACGSADATNRWLLFVYAAFLWNEMPSPAWGSYERVAEWLAQHEAKRAAATAVPSGVPQ